MGADGKGGDWHRHGDLGVTRLLRLFAVMAVLLLALLALAPTRDHFTDWRSAQGRYNARAAAAGTPRVPVGIKQIWKAELDVVDRCPSCHLGMGEAQPDPSDKLFAAHPPVPHDVRDFGCSPCHRGQGRGTTVIGAHGPTKHLHDPVLERPYFEAGCGTCHTHLRMPAPALAERGRALAEQHACLDCHRLDGRGRGTGPDLGRVGLTGFAAAWHERHAEHRAAGDAPEWRASFAPMAPDDIAAVDAYLTTRVGAPRLVQGKLLSLSLGCRGCHKLNGIGGDDGPDLADVGARVAAELDFGGVPGPRTLAGWQRAHLLDPAAVVAGSQMPLLGVGRDEAEHLTVYVLAQRRMRLPEAMTPRDRVRGAILGERDFATDGASLYAAFCSGCHGQDGEGRRVGVGEMAFPAVGGADFLAVADDGFLLASIANGRPGRRMPGWSREDGLRPVEIGAVVAHLRGREPSPPAADAVLAAAPEPALAETLYRRDCRACHGTRGEGSVLGPPLAAPDSRGRGDVLAFREALATALPGMGSFRGYDARHVRSLAAHVQAFPALAVKRAAWQRGAGAAGRGARLFAASCAGCHGARGEGREGPALANPGLQAAATEEFLAATIVRGRGGTSMPAFGAPPVPHRTLDAEEIADVVAFVHTLGERALAGGEAPKQTPPAGAPATAPGDSEKGTL